MHPNASLAKQLKEFKETNVDRHDIATEAKRKGFIAPIDGELKITAKGDEFIEKWLAGPPQTTYVKKREADAPRQDTRNPAPYGRTYNRPFQRSENNWAR